MNDEVLDASNVNDAVVEVETRGAEEGVVGVNDEDVQVEAKDAKKVVVGMDDVDVDVEVERGQGEGGNDDVFVDEDCYDDESGVESKEEGVVSHDDEELDESEEEQHRDDDGLERMIHHAGT